MNASPSPNVVYAERRPLTRVSAYHGRLEAQRIVEHEHREIQFVVGFGTDTIEAAWQDEGGRRGRGPLRDGEIAIIASGQPHTFAWRASTQLSCVYVDPRHLDDMSNDEGNAPSSAIASCFGLHDPLARELVIALAREAVDGRASRRLYADALEQSLLLGAVGRSRPQPGREWARPSLAPCRLAHVMEYIETHFTQDIGLVELAETAGMSRYHFAHAFKAATGHAPCSFVRDRRIEEAKRLLATPLPLAAIAARLGFTSQSHFGARFRAAVGMAPGAYRRAGPAPGRKIAPDRSTRS